MPCDAVLMCCNAAGFLPCNAVLICCNAAIILPRGYYNALWCHKMHCDALRCIMWCAVMPCGAVPMCCDAVGVLPRGLRLGLRDVPGFWSHRSLLGGYYLLINSISVRNSVTFAEFGHISSVVGRCKSAPSYSHLI